MIVGAGIPMFLGAMIFGPARRLADQEVRRHRSEERIPIGFEMLVNNFSAGHPGRRCWRSSASSSIGPIVAVALEPRWATSSAPSSSAGLLPLADIPIELGQGPVPQQRDQPRRARPARRRRGGREPGKGDPLPARDEPGPGPRPAAGLHVRRQGHAEAVGARRDDHPLPRRDPRDLLPVRPGPPDHDRGDVGRRHRRRPRLRRDRCRPGGHPVAGQHLRLPGRHPPGQHFGVLLGVAWAPWRRSSSVR